MTNNSNNNNNNNNNNNCLSNNILMFSTFISIWIYNNFSNNTVNFLSIVFQIVGENLSGMLAINSDYDSDSTNE